MTQAELFMRKHAVLSQDRLYRYVLSRIWQDDAPLLAWCMLNPSTADEMRNDVTIRKCIAFTKLFAQQADTPSYGGLIVVNLFALRSRSPAALKHHPDPIGPHNTAVLQALRDMPGGVDLVAAWGGSVPDNVDSRAMRRLVRGHLGVTCLGRTKHGEPRHPLMLPYSTEREPFGEVQ